MDYIRWFKKCLDETAEPGERTKVMIEVAERMEISKSALDTRLQGKVPFKSAELERAAEYFGRESPAPRRRQLPADNVVMLRSPRISADGDTVAYPVLGELKVGQFLDADLLLRRGPRIAKYPRSPVYPNGTPVAWIARDNSMREEKVHDGMIVVGVDFQSAGATLANNAIVVIERRNRDGQIELSLKKVAMLADRIEFQPRSDDPYFKPVSNNEEVKVIAVCHGAYLDLMQS